MQLQKQQSKCNHRQLAELFYHLNFDGLWCCFIQSVVSLLFLALCSLRFCPCCFFNFFILFALGLCAKVGLIWRAFGGDQMVCVLLIESAFGACFVHVYLFKLLRALVANISKRMPLLLFSFSLSIKRQHRKMYQMHTMALARERSHHTVYDRADQSKKWNSTSVKYSH